MAFGMKHWWGLTLVGIALVLIWRLPPSVMEFGEREFVIPEVRRLQALENDLRRSHEVLKHTRWADSLSALTVASAVDGVAIGIPENRPGRDDISNAGMIGIDEKTRGEFRDEVTRELASLSPRSDVAVGFFFVTADHGRVPGVEFVQAAQNAVYVGERDGQGYCIQVSSGSWLVNGNVTRIYRRWGSGPTSGLGVCRPYLEYGIPGERIGAWMDDGATSFAVAAAPPIDPEWERYRGLVSRRSFFGLNVWGFDTKDVEVDRCLAGYADGCLKVVTDPRIMGPRTELIRYVAQNSPYTSPATYGWNAPFGSFGEYLLADLERDFGEEAFRRFWLSDQEVPVAFEAAFGMPLGEWVVSWVDIQMKISRPGPGLPRSAAMGGMLAVTLCAILAGAWARRRKVA